MKKNDFDEFAEDYRDIHNKNIKISGYTTDYFAIQKIDILADHPDNNRTENLNILNFGCGDGHSEKHIRDRFPNASIYSTDISEASVNKAIEKNKGIDQLEIKVFNGSGIPFEEKFDIILVANVFHHIDRSRHMPTVETLRDSLKAEGRLFIFEHNRINPGTQYLFNTCEFDKGCKMLPYHYTRNILKGSGFRIAELYFINFFPGQLAFLKRLEKTLKHVPLGAQYLIIAKKE